MENQFDVIVMDPPWQLASATPTRGVALGYVFASVFRCFARVGLLKIGLVCFTFVLCFAHY